MTLQSFVDFGYSCQYSDRYSSFFRFFRPDHVLRTNNGLTEDVKLYTESAKIVQNSVKMGFEPMPEANLEVNHSATEVGYSIRRIHRHFRFATVCLHMVLSAC